MARSASHGGCRDRERLARFESLWPTLIIDRWNFAITNYKAARKRSPKKTLQSSEGSRAGFLIT
jgi:hypothetical protein